MVMEEMEEGIKKKREGYCLCLHGFHSWGREQRLSDFCRIYVVDKANTHDLINFHALDSWFFLWTEWTALSLHLHVFHKVGTFVGFFLSFLSVTNHPLLFCPLMLVDGVIVMKCTLIY